MLNRRYFIMTITFLMAVTASAELFGADRILKSLRGKAFDTDHTSMAVLDAETGTTISSLNGQMALNPASCMKLITAASALSMLGPDYRFKTDFLSDALIASGTAGTLYVRGSGDPLLVSEELWRMARNLYDAGLRKVTGGIVIDDSYFDSYSVPKKAGNSHRAYAAKTSAVSVNFNSVTIGLAPGHSGGPAIVTIEPPVDYFRLVNKLKTGGKHTAHISSSFAGGIETITVSGTIPSNLTPRDIYRSVADPSLYAASVFKYVLIQNDIQVSGNARRGKTPSGAALLTSEQSPPFSEIMRDMNKFSNNFIAEQVAKHLGAMRYGKPGSTAKGIEAMKDYLKSIGLHPDTYIIENASGLSSQTRLTAMQLANLLVATYRDFTIRPEFISSLSILGVDGTMRKWSFANDLRGLARAKTGTLGGVSTLAGYVPMKNGRMAAFAILANGLKHGGDAAHRAQLKFVKAISESN